jgi:hypothetical protein
MYFQQIERLFVNMYIITSPIAVLRDVVDTKDDRFSISCVFVSTVSLRMAGIIVGEVIITRVNHEICSNLKYILTYMQMYSILQHVSYKLQPSDRTVMKPLRQTYFKHCCNGEKEPKLENKWVW